MCRSDGPSHLARDIFSMRWPWRTIEYRVSPDRDEWAAPEETLIDTSSDLSTVEVPVSDTIFRIAHILVLAGFAVLAAACVRLAVAKYDGFAQISWRNRTVNVSVPPPRGIIMDRAGVPLVENVPSFDLLVISRQVRRNADGTFADIGTIAKTLGRGAEELTLQLNDGIGQNAVFFLATDLAREQVLSLTQTIPPGLYLITSTKREYANGHQFSHRRQAPA